MSNRPEWMPEHVTVLRMSDRHYDDAEMNGIIWQTGLRAQIAALEEMISGHEGSAMVDRAKAMISKLREEAKK